MTDKDNFIKAAAMQYDLIEGFQLVSELVNELKEVRNQLAIIKKAPDRVFLRADSVEELFGIKRTCLENYVKEGVITKHKLKGLALYNYKEIESKILPVASGW